MVGQPFWHLIQRQLQIVVALARQVGATHEVVRSSVKCSWRWLLQNGLQVAVDDWALALFHHCVIVFDQVKPDALSLYVCIMA